MKNLPSKAKVAPEAGAPDRRLVERPSSERRFRLFGFGARRAAVGGMTAAEKIQVLVYIAKEFAATRRIDDLYDAVISLGEEIFEADNVVLRLWDGRALDPVRALDIEDKRPVLSGESFAGRVFEERKSAFIPDLQKAGLSIDPGATARSVLCVPILHREEALGTISLEKDIPSFFREEEAEILEAMASQTGLALHEARLREGLLAAQKNLDRDLKLGRQVQSQIVPTRLPPWDGLDFSFSYHPKMEVSGDYFDVVRNADSLTVLVADVSGHGISAALVTMSIHYQFRHALLKADALPEVMQELDRSIQPKLPEGTFFSAQVLRVRRDRSFSFVNAGHPRILHHHAGEDRVEPLDTAGNLIGIMAQTAADFEEKSGVLDPGDTLVLHTDGISERKDGAGNEYGEDRLCGDLRAERARIGDGPGSLEALRDALLARIDGHGIGAPANDDRTLLLIRNHPLHDEADGDYRKAVAASKEGRRNEALAFGRDCFAKSPSHLSNLKLLADLHYAERSFVECEPFFSSFLETVGEAGPQSARKMGEIYFYSGKIASAKTELKKAVLDDPSDKTSLLLLVECYLKERAPKKAVSVLKQAILHFPMDDEMEAAMNRVINRSLLRGD